MRQECTKCQGTTFHSLRINASGTHEVSGHDFQSCRKNRKNNRGFSPCWSASFRMTHYRAERAMLAILPTTEAGTKKSRPKLKTPETEASGVSILITQQYSRCCVLRLLQRTTLSFRWRHLPLAVPAQTSDLRPRYALQHARRPTLPLGSVSCPRLDRRAPPTFIGALRILPTSGDPSTCADVSPPAGPTTYSDSHRTSSFSSAGDGTRLAPHAAPAPPAGFRLRIAPAASALRLHRRLIARLAPGDPLSG